MYKVSPLELQDTLLELNRASSSGAVFRALECCLLPSQATWCKLYLVRGDGVLELTTATHADLSRTDTLYTRFRRFPPDPMARSGVGTVFRTGQLERLEHIPEALLPAVTLNDEHLALTRELGLTSSLILPLRDEHKAVWGVLSLARAGDLPGFATPEVETFEALAQALSDTLSRLRQLEHFRVQAHSERRTRRQIQVQTGRYQRLFDASPISTQLMSPEGRTLEVNPAWERFWGIRLQDDPAYHTPLFENPQLQRTGTLEFFSSALRGEARSGPPTLYDPGQHTPGGQARWIRAVSQPIASAGGRVREIMILHLELSLQEREDAVRRLEALGLHAPEGVRSSALSPREAAVLTLLAEGQSNKRIARVLSISENTVKFHVTGLYNKLGVNSRAQAVAVAVQRGWL